MVAILYPFSLLYRIAVQLRNFAFDTGIKEIYTSKYPVISIGNLSVGGTGKTPMIAFLCEELLNAGFKPAIISRGYGRKTKGFIQATTDTTPQEIGDELWMLYHTFNQQITCIAHEKRVDAAKWLEANDNANVYLLDDGFQHRYLSRNFDIVLTTYQKPAWKDFLLPAGRLREPFKNLKRADAFIITKMPELSAEHKVLLPSDFKKRFPGLPVYACKWQSSEAMFMAKTNIPEKVWAFCGLGQPETFFSEVGKHYTLVGKTAYKDHYPFKAFDISSLRNSAANAGAEALICTEKDWIKIKPLLIAEGFEAGILPIGYLPVKHVFAQGHHQALLSRIFAAIS